MTTRVCFPSPNNIDALVETTTIKWATTIYNVYCEIEKIVHAIKIFFKMSAEKI